MIQETDHVKYARAYKESEQGRERERERGVSAFRLSFIAVSLFRNKKGYVRPNPNCTHAVAP